MATTIEILSEQVLRHVERNIKHLDDKEKQHWIDICTAKLTALRDLIAISGEAIHDDYSQDDHGDYL